MIFLFIFFY